MEHINQEGLILIESDLETARLFLRVRSLDGKKFIDVRKFIDPKHIKEVGIDSQWVPTRKGLMLTPKVWESVIKVLHEVMGKELPNE